MGRAPFQILVLPYRIVSDDNIEYAILKRSDDGYWQGIAGGGEDDEMPLETARREASEEGGIASDNKFVRLDSMATIPVEDISGMIWGEDILVVPEYCFAVKVEMDNLKLSTEHTEYRWLKYDEARALLHWDSNKIALLELNHRLMKSR